MNFVNMKLLFPVFISLLAIFGCSNDKTISSIVESKIILQQHSSGFAAACKGKLAMQVEYPGDLQMPVVTMLSCDEMDKENDFFTPFTKEDIKTLEKQIKRINNVD